MLVFGPGGSAPATPAETPQVARTRAAAITAVLFALIEQQLTRAGVAAASIRRFCNAPTKLVTLYS